MTSSPTSPTTTVRARTVWLPVLLAAVAAAIRIPAVVAGRHPSFDDGVYGASAIAMRHGALPFRDVFSSQGPLFLPLVWLFDVVGLRTLDAPRLLALASGVAITIGVYAIARRLTSPGTAVVAALVTTTSGSVLWSTGALAADGPTLAFAVWTIVMAVRYRDEPAPTTAIAGGLLAAASFAVKSLFAVPAGLALAWVFLERRRWRHLGLAVGAAALLVVVLSLPWGIGRVWDQAVAYHLAAGQQRTPLANAGKVFTTLWDRDFLVFALAWASLALVVLRRTGLVSTGAPHRVEPERRDTRGGPLAPLVVWFVGVLVVYLVEHPLWRPHLAHVVPVLAILAAYTWRDHVRWFAVFAALLAVFHVASITGILWPDGYSGAAARAEAALRTLPDGAVAISDEPGFVWRAGLRTPADLVDTSILRIETGRLTPTDVVSAAAAPSTCAVLVWTHRFADLQLSPALRSAGYRVTEAFGGPRRLWTRPCGATAS